MNFKQIKNRWPIITTAIITSILLIFLVGCPPRTGSLINPEKQVTRSELQIELEAIVATAKFRMADLQRQEEIRSLVYNNALVMIDTGTINPIGILTSAAALYGIGVGAKQTKDAIKKKKATA